jgi:transcriptional regulator with XRE-family HTH domain
VIRTDRQYRVSTTRKNELIEALDGLGPILGTEETADWKAEALRGSLLAQLNDLDAELVEYEQLRAGHAPAVIGIESLDELPRRLIQARIAAGMTQRELAERLGLREQQIQRYEAEEYAGAGLSRIRDVMSALGVDLDAELALPSTGNGSRELLERLRDLGLPRKVALRRFLRGSTSDAGVSGGVLLQGAARAVRVFGTTIEDLISGDTRLPSYASAYRTQVDANRDVLDAYTVYAHYVATLLDRVSTHERALIDDEAAAIRAELGTQIKTEPFSALLGYCWSRGLPVLPLSDEAAFYGACWEMDSGPVIVLKQRTSSAARWSFLLGHEIYHASRPAQERTVIEQDEDLRSWKSQPAEVAADEFAASILLGDRAEAIAMVAVDAANGNVARLKDVVPEVAEAGNVAPDVLAYYLAYRLVRNGISWWGTARSFDGEQPDPWSSARDVIFEHVDLTRLDDLDRSLFVDALAP